MAALRGVPSMALRGKTSVSPKANLLRGIYGKLNPAFVRMAGEQARVSLNPAAAEREAAKMEQSLWDLVSMQLGRTDLPVVRVGETAPAGAHWLVEPLASRRNALYARGPLSVAIAYIEKDGTCPIGAVYLPLENICMVAEATLGASAPERLRCGNRVELEHALALLPWKTADVIGLKLLEKLDAESIHTRKSGNTLADVIDVASGRADLAIATRVTRLEALLANLIMAESGGFASDLKGKPLGPDSDTLVVANPKLHAKAVKLLA